MGMERALRWTPNYWITGKYSLVSIHITKGKILNISKMEYIFIYITGEDVTSTYSNKSYYKYNSQYATPVPTIRVPNICDKFHFRWPERVVFGKCQMSFKHTTFTVNKKKREISIS